MRCWMLPCASLLLAAASVGAHAQTPYPNRPIRMIVPLAVASSVDNAARILAQKMSANMGQPIIIENQPGAAGLIGADRVAKSAPDGYTIGAFNDGIMTMVPHLYQNMSWDIMKDFDPVSLVATIEWGLVATYSTPFDTPAELIALAKSKKTPIYYGSGGTGSPQHVAMELFAAQADIELEHVTYKGATQAALGVASGDVMVGFQGLAAVTPMIKTGKLKLMAVASPQRLPQFPDVPTVSATGLKGFSFNSWFALMVPAGTPPAIVGRLNEEVVKALADPEVHAKLDALGLKPQGSTPEFLDEATRAQFVKYGKLIKQADIKPQ